MTKIRTFDFEKIMHDNPCIREAKLYNKLEDGKVQCNVCNRRCIIKPGQFGMCYDRYNYNGTLYVLTYGNISSISCNPIEKKPFFHFWPGSVALTVGSWSCNFLCPWCQNYDISKEYPINHRFNFLPPKGFIDIAMKNMCQGTSFSFNEPTVSLFEYSLDVMKLARAKGLYNTYVTNGYMTKEALLMLYEAGLDAMNIDIKGCSPRVNKFIGAPVEPVWETAKYAISLGIHVEITTLLIPGVNDDIKCLEYIAKRVAIELGDDVPWHITRYFPQYKAKKYGLIHITPIELLEKAYSIGKKAGLKYVYIGNVPGHRLENTYCPNCGELLIKRYIFDITRINIVNHYECPKCSTKIKIIGEIV